MNKEYTKSGKYYDLIYDWKDYKKEAEQVLNLIEKYKKSKGKNLLDVACGTGKHSKYLSRKYNYTGIDLSKEMIQVAKNNFKNLKFFQANMIDFNLNKEFDIITCLFSSIGYITKLSDYEKTISNFSKHLKKGGVLILELWYSKDQLKNKISSISLNTSKDLSVARGSFIYVKGNKCILEMHHMISKNGVGIENILEIHKMGLFDKKKQVDLIKNKGFNVKLFKKDLMKGSRGLIIAVKK